MPGYQIEKERERRADYSQFLRVLLRASLWAGMQGASKPTRQVCPLVLAGCKRSPAVQNSKLHVVLFWIIMKAWCQQRISVEFCLVVFIALEEPYGSAENRLSRRQKQTSLKLCYCFSDLSVMYVLVCGGTHVSNALD